MNTSGKSLGRPSCGSETHAELEVMQIGSAWPPGSKLNQEIARLAGIEGDTPDFCKHADLALERLEELGRQAYIKPTLDKKWVCLIDHDSAVAVTLPFKKEAHAAAAALYFVLWKDKSVVT